MERLRGVDPGDDSTHGRLKGRGLGTTKTGDQYVTVQVIAPAPETERGRELYRQQLQMHEQRTQRVDDRIVSISQPHVRPIKRGKADIDRTNRYMGILYEERGRGILAEAGQDVVRPVEKPDTIVRSLAIGSPADGGYAIKQARESGAAILGEQSRCQRHRPGGGVALVHLELAVEAVVRLVPDVGHDPVEALRQYPYALWEVQNEPPARAYAELQLASRWETGLQHQLRQSVKVVNERMRRQVREAAELIGVQDAGTLMVEIGALITATAMPAQ